MNKRRIKMTANKGDIREISKYFSEIFIDGKWRKCKKVYQRVQGELEQFHDVIIYDSEILTIGFD